MWCDPSLWEPRKPEPAQLHLIGTVHDEDMEGDAPGFCFASDPPLAAAEVPAPRIAAGMEE